MKKYKNGIDFVIVSYIPKGVEYCKLLRENMNSLPRRPQKKKKRTGAN